MSLARPVAFGAGGSTGALLHAAYRWLSSSPIIEAPIACEALILDWASVLTFVRAEIGAHWPALLLLFLLVSLRCADTRPVSITVTLGGTRRAPLGRIRGTERLSGYRSHDGLE